ncbi:hypothetical protein [Olivibacter ginsenosidimutans]|uniref:hypothetical protein n=1 Tax=Olivibacter ginsenosidimutans TaxID=1176537 RepID=UPI0031E66663
MIIFIVFTISADDLKFYNAELKYVAEPGDFEIFVVGNSRIIGNDRGISCAST